MSVIAPKRMVCLISREGQILTAFETDRDVFPSIATHGRDRIFSLIFTGDLAKLPEMDLPSGIVIEGAMYKEVESWRISNRTIDKPRPHRPRKTAQILAFRRRAEP